MGDTMAALIGKKYGKHHIRFRLADNKKTWEGTTAMAVTSLIAGAITLMVTSPYSWHHCLLFAFIIAPVSAFVELISHNGNDTASVAGSLCIVLSILTAILH